MCLNLYPCVIKYYLISLSLSLSLSGLTVSRLHRRLPLHKGRLQLPICSLASSCFSWNQRLHSFPSHGTTATTLTILGSATSHNRVDVHQWTEPVFCINRFWCGQCMQHRARPWHGAGWRQQTGAGARWEGTVHCLLHSWQETKGLEGESGVVVWGRQCDDDDELMLNVLRCHLTY